MGFAGVAHGVRSVGKEMRTPRRALDTQKTVEVGAMIMKGPKKVKKRKRPRYSRIETSKRSGWCFGRETKFGGRWIGMGRFGLCVQPKIA